MAALITLIDMAAQRRGSAAFNRGHHATLGGGQAGAVTTTIIIAVAAEDIRHFQPRSGHRARLQASSGGRATDVGCGSRSKGLEVAQTLLVAIRKYLAVVAKLR